MAHDSSNPVLNALPWRVVRDTTYDVAVLPWGATEAHNLHLPYGTDTIQAERIGAEAARMANGRGASVVVLPAIPFGVNTQQLDIPLTVNMNPSTQAVVLQDVITSLENSGVSKLVILNGHGGNDFRQIVRELQIDTPLFLSVVNWYEAVPPDAYFDESFVREHAGEMETSLMLHLEPTLVLPLDQAGDGAAKGFRIPAMRDGIAWAPRQWTQVTLDTGVGDPSKATAEKGAAYFAAVTETLGQFLVDLAAASLDDLYE
jgi:creatinine amidohydrolase